MRAALFGIGTALGLSLLRAMIEHLIPVITDAVKEGKSPLEETGKMLLALLYVVIQMLTSGARTALPVIAACATAGMVAGTVTSTGLGGQLGAGLVALAGGNFMLVLVMVMIACIILGMGLPTTANYVVTATVAAPILYQNFDVPLIAAHMFVFFFGILADVTPPVCLAAFAGAGIAGANPMRAGVSAMRMAIAGFLIPYAFILEPALLLEGTFTELILALGTVVLGMIRCPRVWRVTSSPGARSWTAHCWYSAESCSSTRTWSSQVLAWASSPPASPSRQCSAPADTRPIWTPATMFT